MKNLFKLLNCHHHHHHRHHRKLYLPLKFIQNSIGTDFFELPNVRKLLQIMKEKSEKKQINLCNIIHIFAVQNKIS